MKMVRHPYDPAALADFYQEAFESLGALSERTWHDRLAVVAEGRAARPWNSTGALTETDLRFVPPDDPAPRQADHEVFPGCPLTFHLAEALRPQPLPIERVQLQPSDAARAPAPEVAEKLWHAQWPGAARWKLEAPFVIAAHFSLLALVRCEIQAIDQHWSLHRLAISLADGARDESLAGGFDFVRAESGPADPLEWPMIPDGRLRDLLQRALDEELAGELAAIRRRQENYLRREVERIDEYFDGYERELEVRRQRTHTDATRLKADERLAAARVERERRRHDQVQRHEIRVLPHFDALLLVAEPAWCTRVSFTTRNETHVAPAVFVPRNRRWVRAQ